LVADPRQVATSFSDKYAAWRVHSAPLAAPEFVDRVRRGIRPFRLTAKEQAELQAELPSTNGSHSPPLRGWLAAPFKGLNGVPIGLVQVSDKYDGEFSPDDELLLVQLAQMASVAFENARLYADLREADRRKDQFLATLAHELRNPLSPLTSAGQLLASDSDDSSQVRELADVISRQCEQLKRLIDDLLDVSRISTGKLHLRYEHVDLNAAISAAVDLSRPIIESSGHRLEVRLPATPLAVSGDRIRIAQIFANLLINAAKYTPPNGEIELEVRQDEPEAEIVVRDNGIGIPREMLDHIFELFTQVDSSHTRSQGGLGIGLTLVKTLVDLHGGSVRAESAGVNQGSSFTVRLPLSSAPQAPPMDADTAPENLPSYRILVVDDNHAAAYLLSRLLNKLGQSVHVAESATQALAALPDIDPQIVISDIAMPEMSGYELASRIRELNLRRRPLLVALTGYGQASDRQDALSAGFDQHLIKPVGLPALQMLLQSLALPA
jgi:signal transduction histidine kinase